MFMFLFLHASYFITGPTHEIGFENTLVINNLLKEWLFLLI